LGEPDLFELAGGNPFDAPRQTSYEEIEEL
jgi:hypothetical protein